ncbi:GAF domain-containing protein [Mesohalobacter halotolerans]|nr:GAF domain-containing protein [Mesohalobacter halotolerans]
MIKDKNLMMDYNYPFKVRINFKSIFEHFENRLKKEDNPLAKKYIEQFLEYFEQYPVLKESIDDFNIIKKYETQISYLFDDLFPNMLSENEIKAASIPYRHFVFNKSKRLQKILDNAGSDFELKIRNFDFKQNYIHACVLILNHYYGYDIDFFRPIYYDIPDKNGNIRHYRLFINADFVELSKTKSAPEINDDIVSELLNNADNLALWQKKFPPNSYNFDGFTILNITDVTIDEEISKFKSILLQGAIDHPEFTSKLRRIFRNIFQLEDLDFGFSIYDEESKNFYRVSQSINSFILDSDLSRNCNSAMCSNTLHQLVENQKHFSIPDLEIYAENTNNDKLSQTLLSKGFKSCLLTPITKNKKLLGVLGLVSKKKNALNIINAEKLEDFIPNLLLAIERGIEHKENLIKAIIQQECTSIHESVEWKFEEEAQKLLEARQQKQNATFSDIKFDNVYPLFGQIDIVKSSNTRNAAIQRDLSIQLNKLLDILNYAFEHSPIMVYEQLKFRIEELLEDVNKNFNTSTEQKITAFIFNDIHPVLEQIKHDLPNSREVISKYKTMQDDSSGLVYQERKVYDDTVNYINKELACMIDHKQQHAQEIFPHYFERFKTDGIEHNMYIGKSISQNKNFSKVMLQNLRLWQMQTMCEMENLFYNVQKDNDFQLEAASLILVYNSTLSIRYRVDEKKFDIDGAYNARYEIAKKRIDKAFIKNTEERITQKGKLVIIYSQKEDAIEYQQYIKYLQNKQFLGQEVEQLELEDLQGISGLKALRVNILYNVSKNDKPMTYEDISKVITSSKRPQQN